MNASTLAAGSRLPTMSKSNGWSTRGMRALVWICFASAIAIGLRIGDPSASLQADPELARLLRGMATIKGLLAVAALAAVTWRSGRAMAPRIAVGYLIGIAAIAGATVMIWQLSSIVPAAIAFHAGALLLLVVAWRDNGVEHRFLPARRSGPT